MWPLVPHQLGLRENSSVSNWNFGRAGTYEHSLATRAVISAAGACAPDTWWCFTGRMPEGQFNVAAS